ncbi:MAG: 30S ribosomal protein S5 [Patescibacteria group bacterium]
MENDTTKTPITPVASAQPVASVVPAQDAKQSRGRFQGSRPDRKKGPRPERVRSEFDQKILAIRRVTRVAAGGRRFSFSVALVLGNRKGSVGVGTGKAGDTSLAIDKAAKNAKKHLIKLALTKTSSIPYEVRTKFSSARVLVMPAPRRGIIAGSALRDVLELGGVKDVAGKIFSGSKNKLNIARATVKALSEFASTSKAPVAVVIKADPVTLSEMESLEASTK